MKVVVEYHGQMRAAVGRAREEIEVEAGCTVGKIMATRKLKGLMFVGASQANEETVLRDGDVVILISPISGGWE
jgi:molybdopterin converting factor small subunit